MDNKAQKIILEFSKIQNTGFFPCPRCGQMAMAADPARNSLSRRVDCYVCDYCGVIEAVEDVTGEKMPISDWEIVQHPEWWRVNAPLSSSEELQHP